MLDLTGFQRQEFKRYNAIHWHSYCTQFNYYTKHISHLQLTTEWNKNGTDHLSEWHLTKQATIISIKMIHILGVIGSVVNLIYFSVDLYRLAGSGALLTSPPITMA